MLLAQQHTLLSLGWFAQRVQRHVARWPAVLAAVVFLVAGVGIIGLGLHKAVEQIAFLHTAVNVMGTVTMTGVRDVRGTGSDDKPIIYKVRYAIITLSLPNGVVKQFEYHFGRFEMPPEKGEKVAVYYNPHSTSDVRVGGPGSLWSVSMAYLLLGVIFMCTGVALYSMFGREVVPRAINVRMQAEILTLLENGRRLAAISMASRESGMDIAEATVYVEELQRKYYGDGIWEHNMKAIVYRLPYKRPELKSGVRSDET